MKKRFLALALGTLAFGVTLGGVKMGLGHQDDAMMVKAEEQVCKTLSFPDDNKENNKVSGYAKTWTAKIGADEYSISNFNNNSWNNKWTYIKCGNKTAASTGSISTAKAMNEAVSKVSFNVEDIKEPSALISISLLVADNSDFKNPKSYSLSSTLAVGENYFVLQSPAANQFYKNSYLHVRDKKPILKSL